MVLPFRVPSVHLAPVIFVSDADLDGGEFMYDIPELCRAGSWHVLSVAL